MTSEISSDSSPTSPSLTPRQIFRGLIAIIVVGLAIAQWRSEQKPNAGPQDAEPNAQPVVAERNSNQADHNVEAEDNLELPRSDTGPSDRAISSKAASPSKDSTVPRVDGLKVHNVAIKNLDGEIVFRGTVDLAKTVERVDAGRVLSEYRHDGIEFKNIERRLPNKPRSYYREWVHPTKGLRGPGPQRVLSGKEGELFYTWDHYSHFVKIRSVR